MKPEGGQLKKTEIVSAAVPFSEDGYEYHRVWGPEVSQELYFADISHNF